MKTELIADYDPAEEDRLDRELERAVEEARVLQVKEIASAEKRLEESKVTPAEYPKIETVASVTPGRPKLAFIGDIGDIDKVKLTPKDERKLATFTPKKHTHEDALAAALAKVLAARRLDTKDLTDEEIAARDKEDAERWADPPKTPISKLEGSGRKSKSEIQAVGFPQDEWTPAQARRWPSAPGCREPLSSNGRPPRCLGRRMLGSPLSSRPGPTGNARTPQTVSPVRC